MAKRTVCVTKSPFQADYDSENDPPWEYSGEAFKSWVWEVLLDMGKAGAYPRNVNEAIDVALSAGYEIRG